MMETGNENMNPKFKLPVHKPDPDLWNRIESEMDYLEMVESTNMNVKEMPVHRVIVLWEKGSLKKMENG